MANIHDCLEDLFEDIADAIREKHGIADKLCADNFPNNIRSIRTGEGSGVDGTVPEFSGLFDSFNSDDTTVEFVGDGYVTKGIIPYDVLLREGTQVGLWAGSYNFGNTAYVEAISVDSLSELHYWSIYIPSGTPTETLQDSIYVDLAQKGSVDGNVYYADSYSIVNGELVLNSPTLIDLYNATNADRQVILGKYINLVKKGGIYRVPSDATVTASKPSTGYHYVSVAPAYKLTYSGGNDSYEGVVVTNDGSAYPQDGIVGEYRYVYNGTVK